VIREGGTQFGFCPGKALQDPMISEIFNILLITAKTGALWKNGAIENQPAWYIEVLGEFLILYDNLNFVQKAEMILGTDDKKSKNIQNTKVNMKR
jgi:hypothetical protein